MKPLEDQQNYAEYYDRSKLHMAAKAKPFGSLGYLEEQACRLDKPIIGSNARLV